MPWRPDLSALDETDRESLVRWHEAAYQELSRRGAVSSGVNALLAARSGGRVLGVDLNPDAVACAAGNAARNGLADRCEFRVSNVFDALLPGDGPFEVVFFDPPCRWLPPRDAVEVAITDEGYAALSRFLGEVADWLAPGGEVLMSFGTSGDLGYLRDTATANGLATTVHRTRELHRAGRTVRYEAFSLLPEAHRARG